MSTLQRQIIKNTPKIEIAKNKVRRIGSLEGQDCIAADYDIDECNEEIVKMFEYLDNENEIL